MIVNVKNNEVIYTFLKDNVMSFLCSKINLIKRKIINRANFVYIFRVQLCNFSI